MATTYTTNVRLSMPAIGDTGWATPVNGNVQLLDALTPIGALAVTTTETPSSTLNIRVTAGSMVNSSGVIVTYAGTASQTVTASQTSYVYLTDLGALTVGTAWPAAGTHFVPLAIVVAGTGSIASVTDARIVCRSVSQ